jgi:polyhydroxybutyrate depolymerase
MLGAMHSTDSFGPRLPHGFIALALVCAACSSDGTDSDTRPGWTGLGSDAPVAGSAAPTAPSVSAPGAGAPAGPSSNPSSTSPAVPNSESPAAPQLIGQPAAPGGSAGDENGSGAVAGAGGGSMEGSEPGGAEPPSAPAEGGAGAPRPSAMCGRGAATPSFQLPNTLFSIPASYDGSTPLPVVMAFHAAGNPNTQLQGILGDTLDDDYIVFYPKSAGNGWTNGADASKIEAMFDALNATACYDQNRVFATGHSSGAQFIVQRLCAGEARWRAVAPVASSVYCSSWAPIPALVIHGIGDTEREAYGLNDGEGLKDIVPYRTSNGCEETYTEVAVQGCTSGGVQVNPGCRDFDGCGERTRWCQHNDPQYGTSHHGVPCFGARVIKDFFDDYR